MRIRTAALILCALAAPLCAHGAAGWTLGPFTRPPGVNPILAPRGDTLFDCPMRSRPVRWEALHAFNPAAVVREGKVYLLYRAEDDSGSGIGGHTSRLGLAVSEDGLHFTRRRLPVLYPAADHQAPNEWDGGCEDPRLVETSDGRYVLTYTQWNRDVPRLAIATSRDLEHWVKHGPAFARAGARYLDRSHKAGAIVTRLEDGRLKAARIRGRYWMYWGEGGVRIAHSEDLIHWTPVEDAAGQARVMLPARPGRFDSGLAEGGPPPVVTPRGILVLYNGKNHRESGDPELGPDAYAGGQALFDAADPTRLLEREERPFFRPELPFEKTGQYPGGTTFLEALVRFRDRWFLYYGCADSLVAVAVCDAPLPGAPDPSLSTVRGQPAWTLANDTVDLAVTRLGAHMAPVTFFHNETRPVAPYYVSPWQEERRDLSMVPVLVPLRGDFFCLPFGGNATPYQGERHPPHGETAGSPWRLVSRGRSGRVTSLTLAFEPRVRPGRVTRTLALADGQSAVYDRTVIEGFRGKTSLAHHAVLATPARERALEISTKPFAFGSTAPYRFSDPARGEYQSLAVGARFRDLARVPSRFRDTPDADCSAFPTRRGFADLLETFAPPGDAGPDWLTALNTDEGWLFYSLKDPRVLPGRVFWIENRGRHGVPWLGRNSCLGVEDGCTFFDQGIAESAAPNPINRQGIATAHELDGTPFAVHTIQGVVRAPRDFGRVIRASFSPHAVTFESATGRRVTAQVHTAFLQDGRLP